MLCNKMKFIKANPNRDSLFYPCNIRMTFFQRDSISEQFSRCFALIFYLYFPLKITN